MNRLSANGKHIIKGGNHRPCKPYAGNLVDSTYDLTRCKREETLAESLAAMKKRNAKQYTAPKTGKPETAQEQHERHHERLDNLIAEREGAKTATERRKLTAQIGALKKSLNLVAGKSIEVDLGAVGTMGKDE